MQAEELAQWRQVVHRVEAQVFEEERGGAEQHRILARAAGGRLNPDRALERTLNGGALLASRAMELLLAA